MKNIKDYLFEAESDSLEKGMKVILCSGDDWPYPGPSREYEYKFTKVEVAEIEKVTTKSDYSLFYANSLRFIHNDPKYFGCDGDLDDEYAGNKDIASEYFVIAFRKETLQKLLDNNCVHKENRNNGVVITYKYDFSRIDKKDLDAALKEA